MAPCDCIILHHRPHRCGLLPVLSTSLYQKHPPARDLLRLEKGMLHQGGCVRARALSAWPWLARLSAGRPRAPLFHCMLSAWTRGPWHASVSQICFFPVARVRASGFLVWRRCLGCSFQTLVVCCDIPSCGRASLVFADTHGTRDSADRAQGVSGTGVNPRPPMLVTCMHEH